MRRIGLRRIVLASLVWLVVFAGKVEACAVCWGGASDSAMIDGAKMSILFMAVLIYTVLGGFIAGFVVISRRGQNEKEQ
jgi:hypothetical protein